MYTYHFHDVERLPDEHLCGHSAMGEPESMGGLSRLVRTWATPPAVPAVRSLTVFDMAEIPKIEQRTQAERADEADVGEQACRVTVRCSTGRRWADEHKLWGK